MKSNTAEDFNTSLVLCLRGVSVKGTVPIWPCLCWISYCYAPSFPVSVPKGAVTQPTWAASTVVLPPQRLATWQIFFSGGVADRCSVVTARYVIFIPPICSTDTARLELCSTQLLSRLAWFFADLQRRNWGLLMCYHSVVPTEWS